jgi:hypothetical protein
MHISEYKYLSCRLLKFGAGGQLFFLGMFPGTQEHYPEILHTNKEFSIVIEHVRLLFIPSFDISFDIYPCPFCTNKAAKRRELFFER